ncbi:hypothetical protein PGUG_04292 [Meyerozyma guilliermondii ATCC 6260]|uniref:Oxidoreductase n=1 Tax=Meyerozyma guilliermondii (strain ATCC 6260 / CBS 566 / DSM 6381 / JCM 1539 / NBRC 10279 / NRRL Y-324) TaxID=294746 RepID=A5DLZ1_PICGU|nr:uncharacterized protein PGUG_04292 [Meyerozyma guilliermondii ATCC 6260]EDK40194.2 hypothetical protein PGUG_04292 [Meyerozyma guilliermondii ATCC 6260]
MAVDNTFSWKPQNLANLEGLKVLVVGGTGGLGRSISQVLASAGATVTVIGQTFRDSERKNIKFIKGDLSLIENSQTLAKNLDLSDTDIVLFTTGIFAASKREETKEGLERDMAVSYLNRLTMIRTMASRLSKTEKNSFGFIPRVFIMAYPGSGQLGTIDDLNQEKSYGAMKAHMNTVAGNESLVYDSASKYDGVHFYGLNPGIVKTNIRDNFLGENSWKSRISETLIGWFTRTPEQYASGIAPLLIAPELEGRNGAIFDSRGKALLPSKGLTKKYASRYVEASEKLLSSRGLI